MSPSPSPDERPPTPPQEESPPRAASSAGGSRARNNGAGLFADPGPGFRPDDSGPEPTPGVGPEPGPDALTIQWEPERVELLLRAQGEVLHTAIAIDKASGEWRYTDAELRGIAPPLTNILNRYDATRAAAAAGDELALIVGLAGYTMRSYGARRAALARLRDRPPEPVSGVHAPEGTGAPEPEPDPFTFPDDFEPDRAPPPLGGRR